jgi:CxxC motif-containing protein
MNASTTTKEIVCIVCPNGCRIRCEQSGENIAFSGQKCKRGVDYATSEMTHPMRSLTTSVKTVFPDSPVVSVRTDGEIEKDMLLAVLMALRDVLVQSRVKIGDIIAENICDTGVNIICTSDRLAQPH